MGPGSSQPHVSRCFRRRDVNCFLWITRCLFLVSICLSKRPLPITDQSLRFCRAEIDSIAWGWSSPAGFDVFFLGARASVMFQHEQ